jgi:hypothetical protein
MRVRPQPLIGAQIGYQAHPPENLRSGAERSIESSSLTNSDPVCPRPRKSGAAEARSQALLPERRRMGQGGVEFAHFEGRVQLTRDVASLSQ